ncbi:helix-turn-helix transcriptional regulator [Leifsonia aquatica]|uniref:helix-turn-helix transcriptional regulator n=1 Tax=Leifsonia aquatica TaxID=144185 RepID=UPI000468A91D|nr:AraC family transcriptional regulator [Leifsonia aquatica]
MTRRAPAALPPTHTIDATATSIAARFLVGPYETCGPGAWESQPHRHDFVELVYVTSGSGTHHVDTDTYPIQPDQLYVVAPGRLHHWQPEEPVRGTLVLFREDFLTGLGGPDAVGAGAWASNALLPVGDDRARIERILAGLEAEMGMRDGHQELALRSLLTLLLVECRRLAVDHAAAPIGPRRGLSAAFERIVRERASAALTVAECARLLAVTPGHLSEVVAAATGRTPGEIIRSEVSREAQRLLARTELSCSQIATQLGFDDASYFSRYFRRECGLTPSAFRAA